MTFTIPKWALVLIVVLIVAPGMLALGYAWGKGQDDDKALQQARKEASAEQLLKFRDSLQGNYDYSRRWMETACNFMEKEGAVLSEKCPDWPAEISDFPEYNQLVTQAVKAMCIGITDRSGDPIGDGGRCPS